MPGTRKQNPLVEQVDEDIDELLKEIDLSPKTVKVGGKVYSVRRDLSGREVTDFWRLLGDDETEVEAFTLLVGPDAVSLTETLNGLPQAHMIKASNRVAIAAGLAKGDDQGESKAS